jgi:hypothetical protein
MYGKEASEQTCLERKIAIVIKQSWCIAETNITCQRRSNIFMSAKTKISSIEAEYNLYNLDIT